MSSTTTSPARPLSFMTRLTPQVYLYTPDPSKTAAPPSSNPAAPPSSNTVPPPDLILFASWMGAGDRHIAKYLTRYRALYPTSAILLIKSEPYHVIFPTLGARAVRPAVSVIRSLVPPSTSSSSSPRLLAHLFSNAGSAVMSHLYTAFAATSSSSNSSLVPPHATIFDSAPGQFTYRGSVAAFSATVPPGWRRTLAYPIVQLLALFFWVWHVFVPGGDFLARLAARHNDAALVRESGRTYVYSEEDALIPWRGVEGHAAVARERGGFGRVRLEKFEGSAHVAHMVADPERYWRVVRETWEGSVGG